MTTEKRTCANCACHIVETNSLLKMEKQSFCRRDPGTAAQVRGERPRMIDGVLQNDRRTGKPIMENVMEMAFLYKPTMPELVCFDGWRPMGTLPGIGFVSDNEIAIE